MKKSFWNRIPVKIILVFIILLLPVYILTIYNSFSYMSAMQKQTLSSVEEILALENESLEIEMSRDLLTLYQMESSSDDFSELWINTGSLEDRLAISDLHKLLNQSVSSGLYNVSYFILNEDRELLVGSYTHDQKTANDAVLKVIQEDDDFMGHRNEWFITEADGALYDVHYAGMGSLYDGVAIYMSSYRQNLLDNLTLEGCDVVLDQNEDYEENGFITITARIPTSLYYVHVLVSRAELRKQIPVMAWLSLVLALLLILCIPIVFISFWRMIVKPMGHIRYAFLQLGSGDTDYRINDMDSSVEFNDLARSFNSMAGEIKDLKIETYEKQLENEKMALQNLMLQIRPHFLLNALNQIFSMAQLQDFESVQRMSLYLSKYFRYLFRQDPLAPIDKELDLLKDYLGTMELRYEDCFEVKWDIDETCLDFKVPPLLIHNFVENIFKYAVSEGQETEIGIALKKTADGAEIRISDDGPGMNARVLEAIQEGKPINKADGTHVGIWNSRYRLKTFCGEKAELKIESVWSEGTTVRILLPEEIREEKRMQDNAKEKQDETGGRK